MTPASKVLADMVELRTQLRQLGDPQRTLFRLNASRVPLDIAFDWLAIACAVAAVVWWGNNFWPFALIVIANRHRSLGNILHDASHRNLWRDWRHNDSVTRAAVAPLLFASLSSYRRDHFKHHLRLGDQRADPDFLSIPQRLPAHWITSYLRNLGSWSAWLGSTGGHLFSGETRLLGKLYIVTWWTVALGLMWAVAGTRFATTFVVLWVASRATLFHMITTFREMCDHFGLQPGGVFGFTREMPCHGVWSKLIHPRNNGYHLTHHLLPAVPYYRLPEAHELLQTLPVYQALSHVNRAYFSGPGAVTRAWQAQGCS